MNIQQIEKHLTTMLARINLIGPKMGNAQSKALITNLRTDIQLIHHAAKEHTHMTRDIVISSDYGYGFGTSWAGTISPKMMYDLIESPALIFASQNNLPWGYNVKKALVEEGFDPNILDLLDMSGWETTQVITITTPYQLHDYDGKEYVIEANTGYWRS